MAVEQTRVSLRAHPVPVNDRWQSPVLLLFLTVNLAHVMEHILQAIQIFALGWPRSQALGAMGVVWPWLVRSEWLHYWYALLILVGLIALRPALTGRAQAWWDVALAIQIWHHFEHALLLGQVLAAHNLFGAVVPTSVLQLFFPRVELHLAYNAAVSVPLGVAIHFHVQRSGLGSHEPAPRRRSGVDEKHETIEGHEENRPSV